jgi:UDPglucose 6-dehydrogenase
MKIGIIGFGYVGRGMAELFAPAFEIVCFDKLDYSAPGQEWREGAGKKEINGCDLAIVCVPTPEGEGGACDIAAVGEVIAWCEAPLILIKSTVPPGTTERLAAATKKVIHFSPEYMGEPKNFVAPWRHPSPRHASMHDFVIVGGPRADDVLGFFQKVMAADARYIRAESATAAELAKYMENAFFATKLGFIFEFAEIAKAFGVSYNHLRELWLSDSRIGGDHTIVHSEAPFFAGKCLPKDLAAIIDAAAAKGVTPELLIAVDSANRARRAQYEGGPI